ncbi:beta-1,4-glucuronyltransferase 1-like [Homarus americanus]|uniref:beta-1,4-glucuronyltransferase 1-like n=1 Tax=Homarus americanus TaxID=6706 RepID=UPI001C465C89|nr:beta-1,4-glucuronyltransferase 1-like [Homarus americanus]
MLQEPDVSSTTKPRVYIFPTFKEEKNIDELPASKVTLKELVLAETVIPLYNEMCTTCENSSFAQEWIEHSGESGLSVFHVGQGSTAYDKWEPIYIGTNSEPIYDEMLSLEGKREKIVQMYTLCLKGYEFHVLDNAFLVYRPGSTKHKLWHRDMFVAEQYTFIKEELIPRYLTMFKEDEKCYI